MLWRKVAKAVDGRGSTRASTRTMSDRLRSSMSARASPRSETTPEPVGHRQVPAEASLPPVDSEQLEGALVAAASDETTATPTTMAHATAAGGALAAAKDETV